ncbi:MAG: adenylyl-sulfate reductase subunit alpha, partial [Desulfotomaculales bacterium]
WGYCNMTTVKGLFAAGDASGASSHKFSSGSHAEGRIAAKSAIRFVLENPEAPPEFSAAEIEALKEKIYKPMELFEQYKGYTTDPNVNPNYIRPKMYMMRLMKLMDEYAGGAGSQYQTNGPKLKRALELLAFLKEDSEKLAAEDLNELMRCWENIHRTVQAENHVRAVLFREETRWPGYYIRNDFPTMDQENWKVFVNLRRDPNTGEYEVFKRPIISIVD